MKKFSFVLILLITSLFLSVFRIGAFAESAALTCNATATDLYPGYVVSFTVDLQNAPLAKSLALVLEYDHESFDIVSASWNLGSATISDVSSETGAAVIAYENDTDLNGTIFTFTLSVKEGASGGRKTVTIVPKLKNGTTDLDCSEASASLNILFSECQHPNRTYYAARESTCKDRGWDAYFSCPDCRKVFAADGETELSAIPYKPLSTEHTGGEATCISPAICIVCGNPYGRPDPNNHTNEDIRNATPSTCTEYGYAGDMYCADCGKFIVSGFITEPLGHDYVTVVTEPTCVSRGYTSTVCSRCNDTVITDYKEPLGHAYTAAVTSPTCTSDGYTIFTCDRCGESYTGDYISALGHDYGPWQVTVEATEDTEGEQIRVCGRNSSHVDKRIIPKLSHVHTLAQVPAVPATCLVDGSIEYWVCSGCNKYFTDAEGNNEILPEDVVVLASGHTWGEWTVTKPAQVNVKGEETRVCLNDHSHIETREIEALEEEIIPENEPESENNTETESDPYPFAEDESEYEKLADSESKLWMIILIVLILIVIALLAMLFISRRKSNPKPRYDFEDEDFDDDDDTDNS